MKVARAPRPVAQFAVGIILGCASLAGLVRPAGAQDISASVVESEVLRALGEGVVGDEQSARPLNDPAMLARWEAGEWTYRITAGTRQGRTERESLTPIPATGRGETWQRTVGQDYTLYVRRTAEGSLVLPSEIAHAHKALVHFEPPLSYLMAGLSPGERREFDGRLEVYSSIHPGTRWYTGRIRATTLYAGVYRVTTPAGLFNATLIRTDYQIDILAVVSVRATLYTFYAEGVGKVAEAEHLRISAVGLFRTDTTTGKVLVSSTPEGPPIQIESP
jgi:hypothetical protein